MGMHFSTDLVSISYDNQGDYFNLVQEEHVLYVECCDDNYLCESNNLLAQRCPHWEGSCAPKRTFMHYCIHDN
jgi:hypothetical protein